MPFKSIIIVFAVLLSRSTTGPAVDGLAFGQRLPETLWHRHLSTVRLQLSRRQASFATIYFIYMSVHAGRYVTARGRYRSTKSSFIWFDSEAGRGKTISHPSDYTRTSCVALQGAPYRQHLVRTYLSVREQFWSDPDREALIVDGMRRMLGMGRGWEVWRIRRAGGIGDAPTDCSSWDQGGKVHVVSEPQGLNVLTCQLDFSINEYLIWFKLNKTLKCSVLPLRPGFNFGSFWECSSLKGVLKINVFNFSRDIFSVKSDAIGIVVFQHLPITSLNFLWSLARLHSFTCD